MTRGLTDPIPQPEDDGNSQSSDQITNDEVMQYLDQLSLLVRDIDTRLSTLERNLFASLSKPEAKPEQKSRKIFKGL